MPRDGLTHSRTCKSLATTLASIDAVALPTSWVLVGMAVVLVAGVLVDGLLHRATGWR